MVKAGGVSLGIKALASELGIVFDNPMQINSDASAAICVRNRVRFGKVRHIEVTQLWLQEKVATGAVRMEKIPRAENLSDALTHHWTATEGEAHFGGMHIARSGL